VVPRRGGTVVGKRMVIEMVGVALVVIDRVKRLVLASKTVVVVAAGVGMSIGPTDNHSALDSRASMSGRRFADVGARTVAGQKACAFDRCHSLKI